MKVHKGVPFKNRLFQGLTIHNRIRVLIVFVFSWNIYVNTDTVPLHGCYTPTTEHECMKALVVINIRLYLMLKFSRFIRFFLKGILPKYTQHPQVFSFCDLNYDH